MEYENLKSLWDKYDSRLDNLEKLSKKLIRETLLQKPRSKLNWHRFQSIFGLIMPPILLIVVFHSRFTIENIDLKFVLGCAWVLGVHIYLGLYSFRSYNILKGINLSADSFIDSAKKVSKLKINFDNQRKLSYFYAPVLFAGVLLVVWNGFIFSTKHIIVITILFSTVYIWLIKGGKFHMDRLQRLEKDIVELEEYSD